MRRRVFLLSGAAAGLTCLRAAAEHIKQLRAISGDRFIDGDQEYLLADIIAPSAFKLNNSGSTYFRQSKSALNALLSGAVIEPENAGPPTRWGGRPIYARRRGEQRTLKKALSPPAPFGLSRKQTTKNSSPNSWRWNKLHAMIVAGYGRCGTIV